MWKTQRNVGTLFVSFRLTNNGGEAWVNIGNIAAVVPRATGFCSLWISDGHCLDVAGTVEDVMSNLIEISNHEGQ